MATSATWEEFVRDSNTTQNLFGVSSRKALQYQPAIGYDVEISCPSYKRLQEMGSTLTICAKWLEASILDIVKEYDEQAEIAASKDIKEASAVCSGQTAVRSAQHVFSCISHDVLDAAAAGIYFRFAAEGWPCDFQNYRIKRKLPQTNGARDPECSC